jgi:dipeptidase E
MDSSGDIILCSSELAVAGAIRELPTNMSVAFIRTASGPCTDLGWLEAERAILVDAGFQVTDVHELHASTRSIVERSDAVFLGGGNTFVLLDQLRKSYFDELLISMHRAGKILIGESAGALVLGPTIAPIRFIDEPERAPELSDFAGLGLLPFFPAVHFGRSEYLDQYASITQAAFSLKLPVLALRDADSALIRRGLIELRAS